MKMRKLVLLGTAALAVGVAGGLVTSCIKKPPTCTLTAQPEVITAGMSATLSWTATKDAEFSIDQLGQMDSAVGKRSVSPNATTKYTGIAKGSGGMTTCMATVTVNPATPAPAPKQDAKAAEKADAKAEPAKAVPPAAKAPAAAPKAAQKAAKAAPKAAAAKPARATFAARDGTGMPMMKGLKNPTELAALVEASLKRDSTGAVRLDPARCRRDGSCATARDYFEGIRTAHPSARLSDIGELPRYLRSLVAKPAPSGVWPLSRLLVRGEQHVYDAVGWQRAFLTGELAWVDPNTGEYILAGDCGNVIGRPVTVALPTPVTRPVQAPIAAAPPQPLQCASVTVTVQPNDRVWYGIFSRRYLPASACWQVCDGDSCSYPPSPCLDCDWKGVRELIPAQYQPYHTTYYIARSSRQTFRFPLELREEYLQVCSFREGFGQSNGLLIKPHGWTEAMTTARTHIIIPPSGFPTFGASYVNQAVKPAAM